MASALSALLKGRYTAHRASPRRSGWFAGLVRRFHCQAKGDIGRLRKAVEANRLNGLDPRQTSRLPIDGICAFPPALGVGYRAAMSARPFVLSRPDAHRAARSAVAD